MPLTESSLCAACGAPLSGRFCAACGERCLSPDDERLGPFLREQWQEATSADGKLWATVKALCVPGMLTSEYFAGRRSLYVRPVRIFLVFGVILFFALSSFDGSILKGPLESYDQAVLYGDLALRLATSRAAAWGADFAAFETAFDARSSALAPTLIGLVVPAFALLAGLMLWPVRASGVRHLVFATHCVAALIALVVLLWGGASIGYAAVRSVVGDVVWLDDVDPVVIPAFVIGSAVYLGVAVRRAYSVPRWAAIAGGIALATVGLLTALWMFRLVLFAATMATLDPL